VLRTCSESCLRQAAAPGRVDTGHGKPLTFSHGGAPGMRRAAVGSTGRVERSWRVACQTGQPLSGLTHE
jgi:hypothetical protein